MDLRGNAVEHRSNVIAIRQRQVSQCKHSQGTDNYVSYKGHARGVSVKNQKLHERRRNIARPVCIIIFKSARGHFFIL